MFKITFEIVIFLLSGSPVHQNWGLDAFERNNLTQFLCQVSQLKVSLNIGRRGKSGKNLLLFWEINMV